MDLGLAGRRAFVAASSAGLGRASAVALVESGARVVLSARGRERLEKTRAELAERGEVHAIAGDVADGARIASLIDEAASWLGGLDILITNSGGPPAGTFAQHDDQAWRTAVDLLLMSTVRLVRAALPHLERSPQPRIVMIQSLSIKQPIEGLVLSNAVRPAVAGLAKTLSFELAPKGILVNVVCPGMFDTDRTRQLPGDPKERVRAIPLARMGRPEELGAVVAFLASARASYVTGTCINVDGGMARGLL